MMPRRGLPGALAIAAVTVAAGAGEWQAVVSPGGEVRLSCGRAQIATLRPGLFEAGWKMGRFAGASESSGAARKGTIRTPGGAVVDTELRVTEAAGGARLAYRLTPRTQVRLNSLHVSMDCPIDRMAGCGFVVDGEKGVIPERFGDVHLRSGPASRAEISVRGGTPFRLDFEKATAVLLQDNRRWGPSFSIRMGPGGDVRTWKAGESLEIAFTLSAKGGIKVEQDRPVTIEAGDEWIPLEVELDIVPGSALDFSKMGQLDAPAGKHGRLVVTGDGRLAFEKAGRKPRRFYGVNMCFSAHYITHEESDRLAERLARLGYNALRFHHHEGELVDRSRGTSTALKPDKLDQLDYLFAALKKRGIYITTDVFVSRPVYAKEIWPGAGGDVGMDNFKMLVPVNDRAFENWKAFARNLLTHVNPYTGVSYAKDPALAWLCMINEGNLGNHIGKVGSRIEADWKKAWNAYLAGRYGGRAELEKAWGGDPGGDPKAGTVPLHKNVYDDSPRGRDLVVFLAGAERDMFARMKKFLRDELGCGALLTNMNGWTNRVQGQAARAGFDYVDDHFYVDHPRFLDRPWRLPSSCPNTSPIAGGAKGGRHCAFVRLLDRPFTISEYNYSGPGRFRGVGGILTGCMAALQGWDVVWRFTYSHNRRNLFKPSPAGYFDICTDPLNQAAERAALCLYLRGDMKPAPHTTAISMSSAELLEEPGRNVAVAPGWHALALVTRVGTLLTDGRGKPSADVVLPLAATAAPGGARPMDPYADDTGDAVLAEMRRRGWLAGNRTDLAKNVIESETGELLVDAPRDVMVLNTPMTAGGYAPEGETFQAGAVKVTIGKTDATVWVSSLDGRPIAQSRSLIITHLTDLQNSGARFGERARRTLLAWGTTPHLVLAGSATVEIKLAGAGRTRVWALATSGRRVAEVKCMRRGGTLVVPLDVKGRSGARMIYEVEAR